MVDLKINDDGTFEMKFIEAIKVNGGIKVKVETPFGTDKITVRDNDYLHITGMPKWKYEVIQLIKKKYENNFKNTEIVNEDLLKEDNETIFNSNL